jgi:hypothetical protein
MKRPLTWLSLPVLFVFAACAAGSARASGPQAAGQPPAAQAGQTPLILSLPRPKGGEWMGLYVLGKKAGYAFTELREGEHGGRRAIVERSTITLRASLGGIEAQRSMSEERVYEYRDGGRLLAFRVERAGDGGEEKLIGTCDPDGIELRRVRPGIPDEVRRLPPTAEVVENADAPRLVAKTRSSFAGASVDLEETLADKRTTTALKSEGTYVVAGVSVPVVVLQTAEEKLNIPMLTTLAADGRILEIKFGEVMVGKAEEESIAKRLDKVDLFNLSRIVLRSPIPDEVRSGSAEAVWAVKGLPKELRQESARQKISEQPDGSVRLTIRSKPPAALRQRPISAEGNVELAEALRSTLAVESEAPAIVRTARKVVGDEKDAWAAARKLNLFVFESLKKTYGASSDRATDVLAARRGDCTEHSLLMTALARAAGIPARRVDGLVYSAVSDGVAALYWHEWVEVFVGEWVAMDPTFNQPVADPTHIALGSEARADTAALIGQLEISALSTKPLAEPAEPLPSKNP